ncbi:hypothetical protein VaNZ11_014058 [Volvox africanus]|uniref:Uncharacterized protein n=1 Tax=Volvox africanus TaxID=51714 RepID=A0ABQ5SIH4_9CHLO|nr:hypothetical protein VaNZ11_014058 [Volvox africanus]
MRHLLCLSFLLVCAFRDGSSKQELYSVQGIPQSEVLNRQILNEAALQSVNKDLRQDDCVKKLDIMSVTPFTFYRGSNALYFRDMAKQETISKSAFYDPRATPWIQGDMHVLNAGRFDNDEKTVLFDLNDFDEAFVANYLYDVYRLATSIVLVARNNSIGDINATACVRSFAKAYRDQLKNLAEDPGAKPFAVDYKHAQSDLIKNLLEDKDGHEAMRKNMLKKWTVMDREKDRRFFDTDHNGDLEVVNSTEGQEIERAMVQYYTNTVTSRLRGNSKYFRVEDIALRKNAGTGSLGTSRYYILIAGESSSDPNDDRILDVKLQGKPAIYKFLTKEQQAAVDDNVDNDADRVIRAHKSLLSRSDDHLGYMNIGGQNFSVRERSPYKKAPKLTSNIDEEVLQALSKDYGVILANAHTRASKKGNEALLGVPHAFPQMVTDLTKGQRGKFADEIANVSLSYAIQVDHDYALFLNSMYMGINRLC